jgi:hypothetical protein
MHNFGIGALQPIGVPEVVAVSGALFFGYVIVKVMQLIRPKRP